MGFVNISQASDWENMKRRYGVVTLSYQAYMVTAVYLLIIGLLSAVGNGFVLNVFYKQRKLLRNPQNLLILNLTLCDLGVSLLGYPFTTSSCFAQRFLYGEVGCIIQGLVIFTFALSAMNTLVCLSVYRYICMCWPHYKYRLSLDFTRRVIAGLWFYTLFWTVLPLLGWSRYSLEPFGASCSIDWSIQTPPGIAYNVSLIVFCYIINVSIMTFCYQRVVSTSRHLMRKIQSTKAVAMSVEDAVETRTFSQESRLVWISLAMVISFAVVWSPYAFLSLSYMSKVKLPTWLTTLATLTCKSSCVINPVIYGLFNQDFRKYVCAIFSGNSKLQTQSRMETKLVVDRTKDGIYLGDIQLNVQTDRSILF